MKNRANAIAIGMLGVGIIIACLLISLGIARSSSPETASKTAHQLLTRSELADYLGVSENEVDKLGPRKTGNGSSMSDLPYVMIGGTTYYPIKAIDKWLVNIAGVSVE